MAPPPLPSSARAEGWRSRGRPGSRSGSEKSRGASPSTLTVTSLPLLGGRRAQPLAGAARGRQDRARACDPGLGPGGGGSAGAVLGRGGRRPSARARRRAPAPRRRRRAGRARTRTAPRSGRRRARSRACAGRVACPSRSRR